MQSPGNLQFLDTITSGSDFNIKAPPFGVVKAKPIHYPSTAADRDMTEEQHPLGMETVVGVAGKPTYSQVTATHLVGGGGSMAVELASQTLNNYICHFAGF